MSRKTFLIRKSKWLVLLAIPFAGCVHRNKPTGTAEASCEDRLKAQESNFQTRLGVLMDEIAAKTDRLRKFNQVDRDGRLLPK